MQEQRAVQAVTEPSVMSIMVQVVEQLRGDGAAEAVAAMKELVALKEHLDEKEAEREFAAALAAFQRDCPVIGRNATAKVASKKTGNTWTYLYATLDEITNTVKPFMDQHGLSYSWDSELTAIGVKVTCRLTHKAGHFRESKMEVRRDNMAVVNDAQIDGITLSYGKRYSLIMVAGLTVGDPDTDAMDISKISESEAADLQAKIEEVGADKARFLKHMNAAKLTDIRKSDLRAAHNALENKRRQNERAAR